MLRALRTDRPDGDVLLPPTEPITLPLAAPADAAPRAVWVQVESGLHVANTAATFVGTVTVSAHGFETMDGAGRRRGTFGTLEAAKAALEACAAAAAVRTASLRSRLAPVA